MGSCASAASTRVILVNVCLTFSSPAQKKCSDVGMLDVARRDNDVSLLASPAIQRKKDAIFQAPLHKN